MISFTFFKNTYIFVFPLYNDGRLVVAYMFYCRGQKSIHFADEGEDGKGGNVTAYLCSVGVDVFYLAISGFITFDEDIIFYIGSQ
jgi:hypothetical protein